MRFTALANRNFLEVWRDLISLVLTIALPVALLLILQIFGQFDEFFQASALTPGIVLFGFVMLMFSSAMTLSRDRESALFSRLLTAPLRSNDFVAGYSVPYLPVAVIQATVLFAVGMLLGLEFVGNIGLVALVVLIAAALYIELGMLTGALFSSKVVPFVYTAVLLLTIFGGAWMDLEAIGGVLQTVGDFLPFAHAMDAMRDVIISGASFSAIATDLYWLIGYTIVIGFFAVYAFRRRMYE